MSIRPMAIVGAWEVAPLVHRDDRGTFVETYQAAAFTETVGHPLRVAQVNTSVSRRGSVRGIHFADVPPSQAKYVTCMHGQVLDVVVDIRVGSPTFGRWDAVLLDEAERRAVYMAEGLGHVFMALTDDATVSYLCSEPFAPGREHGINPFDPVIGINWPAGIEPLLSPKDAQAHSLDRAREQGLLPSYEECQAFYAELENRGKA